MKSRGVHWHQDPQCRELKYQIHFTETHGASGSLGHWMASHRHGFPHCREVHQYRTVQWQFRSSKSSNGCRKSHGRRYRTANHSVQLRGEDLKAAYYHNKPHARGSHTPQQYHGYGLRTPNRWDNHSFVEYLIHIPSIGRSMLYHQPLDVYVHMDQAAGAVGLDLEGFKIGNTLLVLTTFRSVKAVNFVVVVTDTNKSSFLGAIVD
ncbi:unnamed protein product, partial [Meganyctiphanes norvegica]